MKKISPLFLVVATVGLLVTFFFAAYALSEQPEGEKQLQISTEKKSICPVTRISDNTRCMGCHVLIPGNPVKFGIREVDSNEQYNFPPGFRFEQQGGERVGVMLLRSISDSSIEEVFSYLSRHQEVKKLILELHNPGGSMFGMWRIVSLMDSFKAQGGVIETQCQGFSASASFIVFVNGTKGRRFVAPESFHMWHEAMSLSMFDIKTASSTEEEAKLMRKFQDAAHHWLAVRSKVGKDELDKLVAKREYWLTGKEMVEMGFADAFINKK